ncbi:ABC transporter substrate-binding protein [Rossellomorea aquimaris]|uniref:ABC transporter substrate-binding protein n=1 Tax=Rossellomorea aquimaris TaxID=189382 RepID=UPI001CD3C8D7|nr:ABC transporter substrate-binding protein [Rossellomorea aquimaris]MCA1053931.1 ABC transporter substrate-binding protein [Rossellomorea aquimaris]
MKKYSRLLIILLLSVIFTAACGNEPGKEKTDDQKQETVEEGSKVKDALGDDISLESAPERIISLIPSNTEILYELGLGEEVVGVTDFDNYPKEVANKEKIGGMEFNVEKIISLDPDLVLAHESTAVSAKDGLDQLRDAGIKVFVVRDTQKIAEVYTIIENIGKLTGKTEEAEELVSSMKDDLAELKSKTEQVKQKKNVYVEVSPAPELYSPGQNTFINEMLELINAENAMGDQEGWIAVNQEEIIAKNPDVILTTYGYYDDKAKDSVASRDGWQDITAVKEGQIVDVDSDLVTRTGPRLVEGVEEIAKSVYPEIFAE